MGKLYYGIGFFLAALLLSAGFYTSYQISDMNTRIKTITEQVDELDTKAANAASTSLPKSPVYTFEVYDSYTGAYSQNEYRMVSYDANHVVLRQTKQELHQYLLKDTEGYVTVYLEDGTTIYEYTDIATTDLPENMQEEIKKGKLLDNMEDLYSFLENYSS